jgi:hypothetical protein
MADWIFQGNRRYSDLHGPVSPVTAALMLLEKAALVSPVTAARAYSRLESLARRDG